MRLVFDGTAFLSDAMDILRNTLSKVNNDFYAKADEPDSKISEAKLSGAEIEAVCEFYADAIMDSFGTGSLMDAENKFWDDYMSSGLYNPKRSSRPGDYIRGRPPGEYTDIYGNPATSSGKRAGIKIENQTEGKGRFKPKPASRKIQNAESFLFNAGHHKLEQEVERALDAWLSANYTKYFRMV